MDESSMLIIGANGQLGRALQVQYPKAKATGIDELDISNTESVKNYDWSNVKVILNAAAYTDVDGSETTEGRIAAWQTNATAVGNLARTALQNDILFIHVSTDYVFDGSQELHTESEPFSPLSVYGQSKAAGDIVVGLLPKHYILRTSWVIGEGKNFVRTMIGLGQKGINPTVVTDQVGRLTFTSQLVNAIDHLLQIKAAYGAYNVSNTGDIVSWADITREIFKLAGFNLQVTDTTTAAYYAGKANIALRPSHSTFDLSKIEATGLILHDWREDLKNYVTKELHE